MKVLLVLILIVGAFCLGAWTDHVFYMPLGTSSTADIGPAAPSASAPSSASGQTQAQDETAPTTPSSTAPDFRSCLAEARSRHLEAGYAERMCREIVNE